jgi:hypothetical protein
MEFIAALITYLTSHILVRHCIVISPLLDFVKVPAHMMALIVWPVALPSLDTVKKYKDIHIGETHEVHS